MANIWSVIIFEEIQMKKNVLLSIIVPIYNVEKYIGSLVNSLVKQTNKNFEVIFIDIFNMLKFAASRNAKKAGIFSLLLQYMFCYFFQLFFQS